MIFTFNSVPFRHNVLDNKGSRSYYNQAQPPASCIIAGRGEAMEKQLVFPLVVLFLFPGRES